MASFFDQVLSWSIPDILDQNLFKDKFQKIPVTFPSASEYFDAFVLPLLEEVRAELCSSMQMISRAPLAALVSCDRLRANETQLFEIKVDDKRKISQGDVVLLLESRNVFDFQHVKQNCALAYVVQISDSEDGTYDSTKLTTFRVKTSRERYLTNYGNSFYFVCFLVNVKKYENMWNALHSRGNLTIINKVLQSYPEEGDDCRFCLKGKHDGLGANLDVCLSASLNPCRKEVVVASLQRMHCDHKASLLRVCGPPGTGKTRTIAPLLYNLLQRNCRTLMCAATNISITNVVTHVLALLNESGEQDLNDRMFSIADIVLAEADNSFGRGSDLESICLDFRVKVLAECFDSESGWKTSFSALSDSLKKCKNYSDFVRKDECKMENDNINQLNINQLKAIVPLVKRCVSVLHAHLPQSVLIKQNFSRMQLLISELDSIGCLLSQNMPKAEQLRKLSSHTEGIQSLLSALQNSFGELPLPTSSEKESVVKFCLSFATLVFCKTHSSFQLHAAEMNPLNVLVIDEASQLTECEAIVPLQVPGLKHAILFGDEYDLQIKVNSNLSSSADFGRSMFERLGLLNWPKHLLNIQHRMHPFISSFPNSEFYLNQILDAPNVKSRSYKRRYLTGKLFGPYSFINIPEGREEVGDDGDITNLVEVAVVMKIVHSLYKEWHSSREKLSVGVLSPYPAQVMEIERRIVQRYDNCINFVVDVKITEDFQGKEADIIIISTVRSNIVEALGSDIRRINVALTRARHCLWLLGNEKTLARGDPIWKALISNAKERHCLFNADEDISIAQVIVNVKSELDQLDDLLSKDSLIFEHTRWKVYFSEVFVKSFAKLTPTRSKKFVLNFLVRLANGWRPKKYKSEPKCQSTVKIANQYKILGYYIICTIDIVKESGYATQVLKVWDILHLKDVPELVKKLDNIYSAYTNDFLIHCKDKCSEGSLEVPRFYKSSNVSRYRDIDAEVFNNTGSCYAENVKVKDSLLLMKFYSLPAGAVSHLLSAFDGGEINLPFKVTDEEQEIILNPRTSFILGRSGTGKTTVLAMKLFQKEQLYHVASQGLSQVSDALTSRIICEKAHASETPLRQLFVTVNPKLCFSVKQQVSNLKRFVHGENFTEGSTHIDLYHINENEEFKNIPNSFHEISADAFPLIITFRVFLLMLDATLPSSFFDRYQDFGKLNAVETSTSRMLSVWNLVKRKEVTFDSFRMSYWCHFDSRLTINLDSSRVFTEIISYIKGGLYHDYKLSLESYVQLSHKRISYFTEKEREKIYIIFQCYEKRKKVRGEFDSADLVNDLHQRLKRDPYEGDSMDFVYIDEVQDLTMKQIALFKCMCPNLEDGFVFAGDTAQTIARGVDFRFQDIRDLFYREFLQIGETNRKHRTQDKGKISPLFHLSQNFRTHLGVLNIAQSVVDLIYHFFPKSIDTLKRESSLLNGEPPILLDCGSNRDAIMKIFQNKGHDSKTAVNFGSEQVILVRDDSARSEISDYIGQHALVLTIFECKGLEFQDVLLYNFFGSSPLNNDWRVIYEYMELMAGSSSSVSPQSFDIGKHCALCFELKQLYVAITRTRQRLWICERDGLPPPMFDYWKKLNVIQVRELDQPFVQTMQVSSSLVDWKSCGIKMLQEKNYKAAEICFGRASDDYWKSFARAAGLKVSAEKMCSLRSEKSIEYFREAADLFERINNTKEAAQCYFGAEDYERAGTLFLRVSDFQRAGRSFYYARCYERAAKLYAEQGNFNECLHACYEGELFELGLYYIRSWKQQTDLGMFAWKGNDLIASEQKFLRKCALASHKIRDTKSMMNYVKDFTSPSSMRNFLKKIGCFGQLLELEVEFGNLLNAANVARQMGDILREADLLGQAGQWHNASTLYFAYVFASHHWANGSRGWCVKDCPSEQEILSKALFAASNDSPAFCEIMWTNINLLTNSEYDFLELEEQFTLSEKHHNLQGVIMCARRILDTLFKADVSMYDLGLDVTGRSKNRLMNKKVPIKTLICYWNIWKGKIMSIFKYLDSVKVQSSSQYESYGEFCLEYLGVRKLSDNSNSRYVLLYTDAQWVKHIPVERSGKTDSISLQQLVTAACCHWCSELLEVGVKVLDTLKSLYELASHTKHIFSIEGILIHLLTVAAFLRKECKFLNHGHVTLVSLQSYIDLSTEAYFELVFCLDRRMLLSSETTLLSDDCRNLLKEEVLKKSLLELGDGGNFMELTPSQVCRVVVVLLGSNRRGNEPYMKMIIECTIDSPWQSLIKDLVHGVESPINIPVIYDLCDTLMYIYKSNWREEQIFTPPSFIYLLDRLMILVSCIKGHLFATRSSVIEWFMHLKWRISPRTFIIDSHETSSVTGPTFDFLAHTVHQLLLSLQDSQENLRFNFNSNFRMLILRLTVLLCLICLNSENYMNLLDDVLNRSEIVSQLPRSFVQVLVLRKYNGFLNALAQALQGINEPLVIIRGKPTRIPFSRYAIFLNVFNRRSVESKDSILETLTPNQSSIPWRN